MHSEAATSLMSVAPSAQASKEASAGLTTSQITGRLQRSRTETAEEKRQRKELVRNARVGTA